MYGSSYLILRMRKAHPGIDNMPSFVFDLAAIISGLKMSVRINFTLPLIKFLHVYLEQNFLKAVNPVVV